MKKVLGFILGLSLMQSIQAHAQMRISSLTVPVTTLAVGDTVTVSLAIRNEDFNATYDPAVYPAFVSVGLPAASQIFNLAGTKLYGQDSASFSNLTSVDAFNFTFDISDSIPSVSAGGNVLYVSFKLRAVAPTPLGSTPYFIVQLQFPFGAPPNTDITEGLQSPGFTVVGQALPVSLADFNARKEGDKTVALSWKTVSEMNNKGFHLERSAEGSDWKEIGFVASQSENGSSDAALNYAFLDDSPLAGHNLYRLKQVDFDGKYVYSSVRTVSFDKAGSFTIYPNPAKDDITVEGLTGNEMIYINDAAGRLVLRQKANAAKIKLDVAGLAGGVYNIHVIGDGGASSAQKFVKTQ